MNLKKKYWCYLWVLVNLRCADKTISKHFQSQLHYTVERDVNNEERGDTKWMQSSNVIIIQQLHLIKYNLAQILISYMFRHGCHLNIRAIQSLLANNSYKGDEVPKLACLACFTLIWNIPWRRYSGAETCRGLIFVINFILLSAVVGRCINCNNMHRINNIKFLKYKLAKLPELTSYTNFLN